jgi:hypothetical protein
MAAEVISDVLWGCTLFLIFFAFSKKNPLIVLIGNILSVLVVALTVSLAITLAFFQ